MAEELIDVAAPEGGESTVDTGDGANSGTASWPAEVQAEYTKKTQALADERKNWDSQRADQQQKLQQYAQQLQQHGYAQQQRAQQAQQQQPQQPQQQQPSMVDQLRKMPYLDGNTAAQLVERLVGEGIQPLRSQLQQRDRALATIYQDYKTLRDQVGQSQGKQAEKDLDSRFIQLREQHGLPDESVVNELMRDIYYSHEGNDLDKAFPDMFAKRWDAIKKLSREQDRKSAAKARQSVLPGRGGEASLASGKTGGYKTPEQRTNELWPMLNPGSDV
jgi:hypothetical protein